MGRITRKHVGKRVRIVEPYGNVNEVLVLGVRSMSFDARYRGHRYIYERAGWRVLEVLD